MITRSHTLSADIQERLRTLAFRERISESAVVEFALLNLFIEPEHELAKRLRAAGLRQRRR